MRRKLAICLILIFFGFSGGLQSAENIKSFSVKTLDRAARSHASFQLNDSVTMTPLQSYFDRTTKKFILTLNFSSSKKILGYSLYVFSAKDFAVKFVPSNPWYFLWANQPSARQEVIYDFGRRQRFSRLKFCKLLGVVLNREQEDLGDLIIESPQDNSFALVFYTYSFEEDILPEEED